MALNLLLNHLILQIVKSVFEFIYFAHCARFVEIVEEGGSIKPTLYLGRPKLGYLGAEGLVGEGGEAGVFFCELLLPVLRALKIIILARRSRFLGFHF